MNNALWLNESSILLSFCDYVLNACFWRRDLYSLLVWEISLAVRFIYYVMSPALRSGVFIINYYFFRIVDHTSAKGHGDQSIPDCFPFWSTTSPNHLARHCTGVKSALFSMAASCFSCFSFYYLLSFCLHSCLLPTLHLLFKTIFRNI